MERIVNEIETYMQKVGGSYSVWYAGIAAQPRERLFDDHGVREHVDFYLAKDCGHDVAARAVEKYLLDRGCQGGPGGGDHQTKFVYVYRVGAHTRETN